MEVDAIGGFKNRNVKHRALTIIILLKFLYYLNCKVVLNHQFLFDIILHIMAVLNSENLKMS